MLKLSLFTIIISFFIFMLYVQKLNHNNEILRIIRSRTLQTEGLERLRFRRETTELKGWAWLKEKWKKFGDKLKSFSQLNYDCNAILLERINNKCCKLPDLIPTDAFDNCTIRNVSMSYRRRYNYYRRGPMCLYSCVFSDLDMLEVPDEENLNVLEITSSFTKAVGEPWRKLVREAIISCNEALKENVSASIVLTSSGHNCTVAPLLFMKCIKKTLTLSCPSSVLKNDDADCPKDIERLRGCNPFYLVHQNTSFARLLLKRGDTTPTTTPYRPPPRSRDNMPSPWTRPPGPPNGGDIVWHNKNGEQDNTTPMRSEGKNNHDEDEDETQKIIAKNMITRSMDQTSQIPHQINKNKNNHFGKEPNKMTTQFDEWKDIRSDTTRDIEDMTLSRKLPSRRDKFIPKITGS